MVYFALELELAPVPHFYCKGNTMARSLEVRLVEPFLECLLSWTPP